MGAWAEGVLEVILGEYTGNTSAGGGARRVAGGGRPEGRDLGGGDPGGTAGAEAHAAPGGGERPTRVVFQTGLTS